jgi:cytochrome c oxidase subunit 2
MVPLGPRQLAVVVLWLALSLIVIVVYAWVVRSTRRPADQHEVAEKGYRLRSRWGYLYAALLAIAFGATIASIPYAWAQPRAARQGALVVPVVARQFSFSMPARLPADRPIEFRVTSADVNHGFGIYNPQGELIAQVQAMPGYTNVLYITFRVPGRYTIRCLEFCGVGHSAMVQVLDVYQPSARGALGSGRVGS